MPSLIRSARLAARLPVLVASVTLFALMVLTFCDVVLRSALNAPIEAATELIRIAIAIVVFSALPVLSARGEHITVDLADPLFDRWGLVRLRDGLVHTLSGAILIWPAKRVVDLAERARDYGDQTEYLAIPAYLIGWFIAIMTFVTAFTLIALGLLRWFAPHLLETADA
jgi:TRAP-type transport system small permease protein